MKPLTLGKFGHFLVVLDMIFEKKDTSRDAKQLKTVKIMVKFEEFTHKNIREANFSGVWPEQNMIAHD